MGTNIGCIDTLIFTFSYYDQKCVDALAILQSKLGNYVACGRVVEFVLMQLS